MKTIYLIILVFVLIVGCMWIIMGSAVNTMLCTYFWIISIPNQEVFMFPDFENCGR